jgi:hypothetical protein
VNWKTLVGVIGLGLCAACGTTEDKKEPQCSDGGTGACPTQVSQCSKQSDCFGSDTFDNYNYRTTAMPECLNQMTCSSSGQGIQIHFQANRQGFINAEVGSLTTRIIKKVAVDGTPVDCARIEQLASSSDAKDAAALDTSGLFNYQAWDVIPVGPPVGDTPIYNPFLHVTTGDNFVIFTELWSGKPDSNTGLPTSTRFGYACVDSGDAVAAIAPADDNSRTITVLVTR